MERKDKRAVDQIRNTKITTNISPYAEGSALIEVGNTKVICTATVEERVPPFLRNQGTGWVTAEYAMLPRATHTRTNAKQTNLQAEPRNSKIDRTKFVSNCRYEHSANVRFLLIAMLF